jgi:hypothetical protein
LRHFVRIRSNSQVFARAEERLGGLRGPSRLERKFRQQRDLQVRKLHFETELKRCVSRAYKNIADCYYIKTAKVCGKHAAATTKELLQAIIDSILTINCDNVKSSPEVKDPMPEEYIKKDNSKVVYYLKTYCFVLYNGLIHRLTL